MTEQQFRKVLRNKGCPEHLIRAGRTGLIRHWVAFVNEVEEGYELGFYDYANDLDLPPAIGSLQQGRSRI